MSVIVSIETKLADALRAMIAMEEWDDVEPGDGSTIGTAKAVLNEWEQTPERWVMKVVVISSSHVKYDAFTDYLDVQAEDQGSTDVRYYGDGYMLYAQEHIDAIPESAPPELANVLCWAMNRGFTHVRLDPDGDTVAELPSFDW